MKKKDKPWESMYRALLKRLTQIAYPEDYETLTGEKTGMADLKVIVNAHNALLAEHDRSVEENTNSKGGLLD
jgi:hypothetical protein|tara:strand:- start:80 stop:295 length:216 start_codon:yes stop_codon:yes gene_type:complete